MKPGAEMEEKTTYMTALPYVQTIVTETQFTYPIHGIDISRYQEAYDLNTGKLIKHMDCQKAKDQGISFVFARLSAGDYYTDPSFLYFFDTFMGMGIPVIPYHVTRHDCRYERQAERVILSLKDRKPLTIIQDLEVRGGTPDVWSSIVYNFHKWALKFFGISDWFYLAKGWTDEFLLKASYWKDIPIIIASWLDRNKGPIPTSVSPTGYPLMPFQWQGVTPLGWQWSADKPISNEMGPVYGACSRSIDRDVIMDTALWYALTGTAIPQPPPVEPPSSLTLEERVSRLESACEAHGIL